MEKREREKRTCESEVTLPFFFFLLFLSGLLEIFCMVTNPTWRCVYMSHDSGKKKGTTFLPGDWGFLFFSAGRDLNCVRCGFFYLLFFLGLCVLRSAPEARGVGQGRAVSWVCCAGVGCSAPSPPCPVPAGYRHLDCRENNHLRLCGSTGVSAQSVQAMNWTSVMNCSNVHYISFENWLNWNWTDLPTLAGVRYSCQPTSPVLSTGGLIFSGSASLWGQF